MCQRSQALTRQRFGKVIRLFAPLYLSNECVNNCKYCGFSRDNPILRVTLERAERCLRRGARLREQGFRNILLVAGEHPKFVSDGSIWPNASRALHAEVPGISLELGPMETEQYRALVRGRRGRIGRLSGNIRPRAFTAKCTPPGRSAISIGGWKRRSALMRRDSAGWGSAPCSAWATGGARPCAWRLTPNTCCAIAGRRN